MEIKVESPTLRKNTLYGKTIFVPVVAESLREILEQLVGAKVKSFFSGGTAVTFDNDESYDIDFDFR